eukprot:TRINITY_DN16618_c0_g1_i1.p1 TRINITY_DN16618_c0_g1~~TRINITY_DN16618_c0_g1_i1.p1  ORF type:complete len:222 (+),score=67.02 TRINITY_DN16618_c0_g1_i1:65-730(+)
MSMQMYSSQPDDGKGDLPEGWEWGVTAEGRTFFVHHATQEVTWDDPRVTKCQAWLNGHCPLRGGCAFAHPEVQAEEMPPPPSLEEIGIAFKRLKKLHQPPPAKQNAPAATGAWRRAEHQNDLKPNAAVQVAARQRSVGKIDYDASQRQAFGTTGSVKDVSEHTVRVLHKDGAVRVWHIDDVNVSSTVMRTEKPQSAASQKLEKKQNARSARLQAAKNAQRR